MSRDAAAAAVVSVLVLAALTGFLGAVPSSATTGGSPTSASSVAMPSARNAHAMAYDTESNRIVLFGGADRYSFCGLSDTWTYDVATNSWQDMNPAPAPPGRCCAGMAYDSKADRIIMFGGAAPGASYARNDTWAYNLNANTWTELYPYVSPPARTGGQLVYDVRLDRLILFGGHRLGTPGNLAFNDTWRYDLNSNTWTQVTAATAPSLRAFPAMAYDVESDRVVLFGGETEPNSYADSETWAYDPFNETWAKMAPATSPPRSFAAAATYDAKADRVLVFGGTGYPDDSGRNDTWAYDFNADAWSKIDTSARPSNRLTGMAYDAKADRTILFGGSWPWALWGVAVDNRETWSLDYANSTWTKVLGPPPPLPPVASFTFSPTSPAENESVTFDASGSSDPDGTITLFAWYFGVSRSWGVIAHQAFAKPGTYTVSLTVTDDDGLTNTTTRQVVVRDTVNPILAIASPADGDTINSTSVTVAGTASDNVGVARVELSLDNATWSVATGTTSWSAILTLAEGANTIYVRVADTAGNTVTSAIHVTVTLPPPVDRPPSVWVWPLVAVGIGGDAAAAYLLMRRRRKPAPASTSPPH